MKVKATKERAERNARPGITDEERKKYKGIGRHPLARRWLLRRYNSALERRDQAEVTRLKREMEKRGIEVG